MTEKPVSPLMEMVDHDDEPMHDYSNQVLTSQRTVPSQSNKELIVLSLAVILSLTRQAPWDEHCSTHGGTVGPGPCGSGSELSEFNLCHDDFNKIGSSFPMEIERTKAIGELFSLGKSSRITDWLSTFGCSQKAKVYPTVLESNVSCPSLWSNEDAVTLSFYQESSKDILSVVPKPESLSSGSESPPNVDSLDYLDWKFLDDPPWDSIDPEFIGFLNQDDLVNGIDEASGVSNIVAHNHTYAASSAGSNQSQKLDMRSASLRNRDVQRLEDAGISVSYSFLVECSNQEFLHLLRQYSSSQQSLLIAVRKRGKNRLAAATCRARKEAHSSRIKKDITSLLDNLPSVRQRLNDASNVEARLREKYIQLYLRVLSRIRDPSGARIEPRLYQVLHDTVDGVCVKTRASHTN